MTMIRHSDLVVQWQLRGRLARFWWQSRNRRRHWWQSRPVLFGAKWGQYYRDLKAEAETLVNKERWWENHA